MKHFDSTPLCIVSLNWKEPAVCYERNYMRDTVGFDCKELLGRYKGSIERSYAVPIGQGFANIDTIKHIALQNDQEAFLYLDNQRNAYLYSRVGSIFEREYIGRFVSVDPNTAMSGDHDFTKDIATDTYWMVR